MLIVKTDTETETAIMLRRKIAERLGGKDWLE
jgi:hypothetical protein